MTIAIVIVIMQTSKPTPISWNIIDVVGVEGHNQSIVSDEVTYFEGLPAEARELLDEETRYATYEADGNAPADMQIAIQQTTRSIRRWQKN